MCRLGTPVRIMYGKSVRSDSYMSRTYHIETEIGSGGSGAVYLAWHKRLRKYVVIKTAENSSSGFLAILRNEVEALKNIKSMHVPQVLDFLVESEHCFTIMEYIEGESFDILLKSGQKFTENQILMWYRQLSSALDVIHKQDVFHRDIKPSNIMLTKNGDACLIDFNSAFVSGNNTGVISRSMGYASPEQYEFFKLCRGTMVDYSKETGCIKTVLTGNNKQHTAFKGGAFHYSGIHEIDWKLSDIYSLGATMYHFMTGKRPPVKADDVELIPYLIGYSRYLLRIIERSMRADPSQRFASAKELGDAVWSII